MVAGNQALTLHPANGAYSGQNGGNFAVFLISQGIKLVLDYLAHLVIKGFCIGAKRF